jgi:hypothetical protein
MSDDSTCRACAAVPSATGFRWCPWCGRRIHRVDESPAVASDDHVVYPRRVPPGRPVTSGFVSRPWTDADDLPPDARRRPNDKLESVRRSRLAALASMHGAVIG